MGLREDLERANAQVNVNDDILEVSFGNKNGFIRHKMYLNNFEVNFDTEKQAFLVNEKNMVEVSNFRKATRIKPVIIFDMDGVLINTNKSFPVVTSMTYNHFTDKELTCQEINEIKYKGGFNSDWDILMHLFKEQGYDVTFEDMTKYYMDIYFNGETGLIDAETLIITENFLKELAKDYNLAIFTGRDTMTAQYTLRKWDIEKYFYPIITYECVGEDHQKPDTKGVNIIKEKVIAEKFYYLGDTVDDMSCARNSGVNGVGVLPPRDKSEKLKSRLLEEGAVVCLNTTADLISYLRKSNTLVKQM